MHHKAQFWGKSFKKKRINGSDSRDRGATLLRGRQEMSPNPLWLVLSADLRSSRVGWGTMWYRKWMDWETVSPGQCRCEAVKQWGTGRGQCWTFQGSALESFTLLCYNCQLTTSSGGDTTEMRNKGECLGCGDRLHAPGKGQLLA